MLIITSAMITALVSITQCLPIGTNLGMPHLLWALVSGQLLKSRGAIFPALHNWVEGTSDTAGMGGSALWKLEHS